MLGSTHVCCLLLRAVCGVQGLKPTCVSCVLLRAVCGVVEQGVAAAVILSSCADGGGTAGQQLAGYVPLTPAFWWSMKKEESNEMSSLVNQQLCTSDTCALLEQEE